MVVMQSMGTIFWELLLQTQSDLKLFLQKKINIGDRLMLTIMKFIQLVFFVFIASLIQETFATETSKAGVSSRKPLPEVVFETTMGTYTLELNPEKAPKTVANFLAYVDEGFYNNTLFHRVIPRFVVQGGGFIKGMKKKENHYPVINESNNGLTNIRGAISMARARDPQSATSQFFINPKSVI
jgi:hypothetical protein